MNSRFAEPKKPETVKNEKVLTSKRLVTLLSLMKKAERAITILNKDNSWQEGSNAVTTGIKEWWWSLHDTFFKTGRNYACPVTDVAASDFHEYNIKYRLLHFLMRKSQHLQNPHTWVYLSVYIAFHPIKYISFY